MPVAVWLAAFGKRVRCGGHYYDVNRDAVSLLTAELLGPGEIDDTFEGRIHGMVLVAVGAVFDQHVVLTNSGRDMYNFWHSLGFAQEGHMYRLDFSGVVRVKEPLPVIHLEDTRLRGFFTDSQFGTPERLRGSLHHMPDWLPADGPHVVLRLPLPYVALVMRGVVSTAWIPDVSVRGGGAGLQANFAKMGYRLPVVDRCSMIHSRRFVSFKWFTQHEVFGFAVAPLERARPKARLSQRQRLPLRRDCIMLYVSSMILFTKKVIRRPYCQSAATNMTPARRPILGRLSAHWTLPITYATALLQLTPMTSMAMTRLNCFIDGSKRCSHFMMMRSPCATQSISSNAVAAVRGALL